MIDMDDTITIDGYITVVNNFLKTHLTYDDIPGYWVDEIVPEKQLNKYLNTDYRYIENCVNIIPHKHKWLLKHLPSVPPDNFIFTSNKGCINAEIKIDDKISNLEGNAELKLLITAYHNKKITDEELKKKNIIRVNSWDDIAEILLNH